MKTMHDNKTIRCKRLGHPVAFRYCRTEAEGKLCPQILNCWWQVFDVRAFLSDTDPEALDELTERPSQPKLATIVDLIEAAKRRARRPDNGD